MEEMQSFFAENSTLCYIIIAIIFYFLLLWATKILSFHYKQNYEKRKKKKEAKKLEKQKWKYARVTSENPLLNSIVKSGHFIVIDGVPGAGKTIMANLLTKFVLEKRKDDIHKKRRFYKYTNPKVLKEEETLIEDGKLATYSNLDIKDKEKRTNKELMPYLLMQRKAVIDEIGQYMGKDLYYESGKGNPLVMNLENIFRFIRHYLEGYIIATEQDGENIYIGIRRIGYTSISIPEKTKVFLSKAGKKVLKLKNILNFILPGFLTINYKRVFRNILFKLDSLKTILKLLLPTYFMLPKEYYAKRKEIFEKTNKKYLRFVTKFTFNNAEYYIRYTNADIYEYNTRAHKDEYDKAFNKDGTAKEMYISE